MNIADLGTQAGRRLIELQNNSVHFIILVTFFNEENNEGPFVIDWPVPQGFSSHVQLIFYPAKKLLKSNALCFILYY